MFVNYQMIILCLLPAFQAEQSLTGEVRIGAKNDNLYSPLL